MPYERTTNFKDSNNVDLGKKLVTRDYLIDVYAEVLESVGSSGLTSSANIWGCGWNAYGQLGGNNITAKSTPVTVFGGGSNWTSIHSGYYFSAGCKADGTLWTWGSNTGLGALGTNDNVSRLTPTTTFAGGTNWKYVGGQSYAAFGVKTDGTLWVWGANGPALGLNTDSADKLTPVTVFGGGTNWKYVTGGNYQMYGIKTDGTLWCWGDNTYAGMLGTNDATDRPTPVTTFAGGTNWKMACGLYGAAAAVKTDGTLWTWGRDSSGRLGINSNTGSDRLTPITTFAGGTNWVYVGCGQEHIGAIKTDGTLWVWGRNTEGQLGINDTVNRSTPVTTFAGGTNWKYYQGGFYHSVAMKTDGTLWVWGDNAYGTTTPILGTNDAQTKLTPVTTFIGGTEWKRICRMFWNGMLAISSADTL